jgi:hypothetical protein
MADMKGQEQFTMKRTALTIGAAFGLALIGLVTITLSASAQDGSSLVLGVMQCPDGYDGDNFADDCTTPAEGIEFSIGTPNTDNTETTASRGDGLTTFSLAPYDRDPNSLDTVSVGEPATQTSDYAVFCTVNGSDPLDFSYESIDFAPGGPLLGITFDFNTGDDVACDWYRIRRPMPGEDDDGGDVDQLPTTGAGPVARISGGSRTPLSTLVGLALLTGATTAFTLRRRLIA